MFQTTTIIQTYLTRSKSKQKDSNKTPCKSIAIEMPSSSQESLYCASLPDEKIDEIQPRNYPLRKTSSMTDIDRFHRYYDHINDRLTKNGSSYAWDKFVMGILEMGDNGVQLSKFEKLSLGDNQREAISEMELTSPYKNAYYEKISTKPKSKRKDVHWITPTSTESVQEWPTPGKVHEMIKYWSSPELSAKINPSYQNPNDTPKTASKINAESEVTIPRIVRRKIVF